MYLHNIWPRPSSFHPCPVMPLPCPVLPWPCQPALASWFSCSPVRCYYSVCTYYTNTTSMIQTIFFTPTVIIFFSYHMYDKVLWSKVLSSPPFFTPRIISSSPHLVFFLLFPSPLLSSLSSPPLPLLLLLSTFHLRSLLTTYIHTYIHHVPLPTSKFPPSSLIIINYVTN